MTLLATTSTTPSTAHMLVSSACAAAGLTAVFGALLWGWAKDPARCEDCMRPHQGWPGSEGGYRCERCWREELDLLAPDDHTVAFSHDGTRARCSCGWMATGDHGLLRKAVWEHELGDLAAFGAIDIPVEELNRTATRGPA